MNVPLLEKLQQEGLISKDSFDKAKEMEQNKLFSVHWELKTILYLGITLLVSGLGILVYKNIDTIGHQFVLAFIAIICIACFYYCFTHELPFSTKRVLSPNIFFDYALLLGSLTLLIFIAYIQFEYNVFGSRYGLATFIPMLVLFFTAYNFDHLGILSLAITNLAAWLGITVTPLQLLKENDFNSNTIIITGILLGILLNTIAFFSEKKDIKKHFAFTYLNFGMHILFISCLAAMFNYDNILILFFLLLLAIAFYFYKKAVADKSFYILLICSLYTYIGLSYVVIHLLFNVSDLGEGIFYLTGFYFILSAIILGIFLMNTNKKFKPDAGI